MFILLLEFYISLPSTEPEFKSLKAGPIDFSGSPQSSNQ